LELEKIADECSNQERISAKAENNVVLLKKLRLLKAMQGKTPYREFDAIVTRVKPFGVYFEIVELMLEGFIHVSDLGNDFFDFDDAKNILKGSRRGAIFKAGNKVTVIAKEIDLITLNTRWDLVVDSSVEPEAHKPVHKGKKPSEKSREPAKKKEKEKKTHARAASRKKSPVTSKPLPPSRAPKGLVKSSQPRKKGRSR
jgi:ribonuclease R